MKVYFSLFSYKRELIKLFLFLVQYFLPAFAFDFTAKALNYALGKNYYHNNHVFISPSSLVFFWYFYGFLKKISACSIISVLVFLDLQFQLLDILLLSQLIYLTIHNISSTAITCFTLLICWNTHSIAKWECSMKKYKNLATLMKTSLAHILIVATSDYFSSSRKEHCFIFFLLGILGSSCSQFVAIVFFIYFSL